MFNVTSRKMLLSFCVLTVLLIAAVVTAADVKTTKMSGTVIDVYDNNLVVKMSSGDVKIFNPPADRKFIIDGQEKTLADLQVGTHLTATITETTTTATQIQVDSISGQVLYASGPTVVLKLSTGEARKFFVGKDHPAKFTADGKDITVFELKKGMNVTATKISEVPVDVLSTDSVVTGSAPKMAKTAEAASAGAPAMPKTGSSLPLFAQLGVLFIVLAFGIRRFYL